MRVYALVLAMVWLCGCGRHEPMQLWYWHHSYLVSGKALADSEALVDRAAAAGYTGVALWDSSLVFLDRAGWDTKYLEKFVAYAHGKGLVVMPAVLPYGHSDDVLKDHPDWAEGQRVVGVKSTPGTLIALGNNRFLVEPWHQYRVKFAESAVGPVGALDASDSRLARLVDEANAGATEFVFNSAASATLHVFGPSRFVLEEVASTNVVGPVERHADGSLDYYAISSVYGEGRGLCLTNPEVQRWAVRNVGKVVGLLPAGSPLFLQHDEMRQMNSCASCRTVHKSAGELLAWSLRGLIASLPPAHDLYIWSDMFDPWHNARDHFYYVEGDLRGSWEGLPKSVTLMNWNGPRRRASLAWFASRGNKQVIAGYYDAGDGWRSARRELFEANGVRGVQGVMYTTWRDDYSQLESYAAGARAQWGEYLAARPW
jgi:hypothetical protein